MSQQISISEELWKYLNINKEPGESFDEVIIRLLKIKKGDKKDGLSNKN